jgi:hypothetical protein
MWKLLISCYVLSLYTMKKAASYATFEHKQAAFTHGKHSLVLFSTTCQKNHKEW